MKIARFLSAFLVLFAGVAVYAQGTAPTFRYTKGQSTVTLPGHDPAQGGTTVIPTVLVPVQLVFDAAAGRSQQTLDAAQDIQQVLHSPIFSKAAFGTQGKTQYLDAMLRATTGTTGGWHTLLGKPEVHPVTVEIPAGYGYVLTSKSTKTSLGMADLEYVQRAIFKQIPQQQGKLVIAVTDNTGYYAYGDATVCCSFGTHGVDEATGNSFVLASYLGPMPPLVQQRDIQPLTEQVAEWVNNPLHNPLLHESRRNPLPAAENVVPAWEWPARPNADNLGCGGTSPAARYTLENPVDTNRRSDLPAGPAWVVHTRRNAWHVANVALMGWYTNGTRPYSFPDADILPAAASPCPAFRRRMARENSPQTAPPPAVAAVPSTGSNNGHELIGYWTGSGPNGTILRLRDVSPQWDVILVAFANVNHQAPEGTLQLRVQPDLDLAQMKSDIAWLKSQGKKVLISLGGGGEYFTLDHKSSIPNFVNSVTQIVTDYGFDGVDLDFESPSLTLDPGDNDFRHPTTPSIVNLIAGLHQLRDHFGPGFMLTLVPEGTQIPAGYPGYGGQFGTYLPLLWGTRDMLTFVDVQDYNTPPLQGLDGEIYQLGSVDYDAAMTELLLHGFNIGGHGDFFPPVPANQVAVGFLVGPATPKRVTGAMQYIITGKAPEGVTYKLQNPSGYPGMIGAMFWTIDADRRENYAFSNTVGPQLHGYPAGSAQAANSTTNHTQATGKMSN